MRNILVVFFLILAGCDVATNSEVDKILKAKAVVKSMVNYPDTLSFHEFSTNVSGNNVTLTFTCKNAFGTPETHTRTIKVD